MSFEKEKAELDDIAKKVIEANKGMIYIIVNENGSDGEYRIVSEGDYQPQQLILMLEANQLIRARLLDELSKKPK